MTQDGPVTSNNTSAESAPGKDDPKVVQARQRLQSLYESVEAKGGWRAVQSAVGSSNVQYAYNFVMHGLLPTNPLERAKLLHWKPGADPGSPWTQYPTDLEIAVLEILHFHRGREQAIGREALVEALARRGLEEHERAVREAIKQLRRQGQVICSLPGRDGGYYLATSLAEFEEFDRVELGAKIADMSETREAMRKAARSIFGENAQMRLI